MNVKTAKALQSGITRAALLAAARSLFADRGYAESSTEELVARTGMTRGALYHHFDGKRGLFEAVFENVHRDLVEQLLFAASGQHTAWERLLAGCQRYLDAAVEPSVQRIVLIDGPAVLGWAAWREVGDRYGIGLIQTGLEEAIREGFLEPKPVEPLAHILSGAIHEAALMIARSEQPSVARAEMGRTLDRMLSGLRRA